MCLNLYVYIYRFKTLEGVELLLRCMNEHQYAAGMHVYIRMRIHIFFILVNYYIVCAVKTLKFALMPPEQCTHFIHLNGLKFIFPVFMGHNVWKPDKSSTDAALKKKIHAEKYVCEESSISIISQLCVCMNTSTSSSNTNTNTDTAIQDITVSASRLFNKFTENQFEKLERCVELYIKYNEKCKQTEESLRSLRYSLLHAEKEELLEDMEDVEVNYMKRCDGGLVILQELAIIIIYVCITSSSSSSSSNKNETHDECIRIVQSKLHYHSLTIDHILSVLRECIAHINTEELNMEEEEEEEEVYKDVMMYDESKKKEWLLWRRQVLLQYSASFSKSIYPCLQTK